LRWRFSRSHEEVDDPEEADKPRRADVETMTVKFKVKIIEMEILTFSRRS
jgi:hypothetical protein